MYLKFEDFNHLLITHIIIIYSIVWLLTLMHECLSIIFLLLLRRTTFSYLLQCFQTGVELNLSDAEYCKSQSERTGKKVLPVTFAVIFEILEF